MAHCHNRFVTRILLQQPAEVRIGCIRLQRRVELQLAFVSEFVADERSRLSCPLQWTGNDHLRLSVNRSQSAADVSALLDTLGIERPLLVFLGIRNTLARTGMADEVNNHDALATLLTIRRRLRSGRFGIASTVC